MIEVSFPDLHELELTLVPGLTVRGSESAPHDTPLAGRVALGGPLAVPVTTELVSQDPELKAFIEAEADCAVYHLVHVALTCRRGASEPTLHSVTLDLKLTADATAPFQPVAWSMTPKRLTEQIQATTTAQLGPQLGFVSHSRTTPSGRVCLEALRELRSDPGWEIRHTRTVPIDGTYRLAMVVRAPRGVVSRAEVAVGATVRTGPVLRRYRREVPDPVRLTVEL